MPSLKLSADEDIKNKVTICPGFSGTVSNFNMFRKKSQFFRDAHLSRFWLVSQICPDLPISAAVWLCIGGQKLAQNSIGIYERIAGGWGSAPDPDGGGYDAPQTPMSDPQHPTLVPDCDAQIMVTLINKY